MKLKTKFRILEFVIFGIFSNLADNLLTLYFFGDQPFGWRIVALALIFVIPFAIIEELIVDHPKFWLKFCKVCGLKINPHAETI
ncbi:MAG: hypothetical protein COV96_01185 [Candidatus Zambryskibacteria bacterium CG11_big_fil_rev_8_21_14_0_20_42_18]|uniref:VUT family protein n=1 Tax=Candidatus Zambryskibacteria bacterium CG_4_9_14_3_um_filter_42_15 TaxID=1975112 RepID=A0A2M7WSX6_9BACT|nr:MAG: hypothetical protein COV96_01185 [Candidatus Zambryskibacteria bacterium CG11_big_fil_rev_8_21_14_0_20_42_18]PJA33102.1 MAG: hypothetical protein CO185_00450 [Candidatus Zambryskibacteria bacterium CG_4_9_14_3_um_filter_42_15]